MSEPVSAEPAVQRPSLPPKCGFAAIILIAIHPPLLRGQTIQAAAETNSIYDYGC